MYTITYDNGDGERVLYTPAAEPEGYDLISAQLETGINQAGRLTVTLPPMHPALAALTELKTQVFVYDTGELLWFGRVWRMETDYTGCREVECEGAQAWLNDVVLRPCTLTGTPAEMLQYVVQKYNAGADARRQFVFDAPTPEAEAEEEAQEETEGEEETEDTSAGRNWLTYPMRNMCISQSYTGRYSHYPHTTGSPADYPIDEAGAGGGREYMYCPCNAMIVKRIHGVGGSGTNTIWLESTSPVVMPCGEDYVSILVMHPNDDTLGGIHEGDVFHRGDQMFLEGNDGWATGYHFHMAIGRGKFTGTGWTTNSNGKAVNVSTGRQLKPEDAFYLDRSFTTVISAAGLKFTDLPADAVFGSEQAAKEASAPGYRSCWDAVSNDILEPAEMYLSFTREDGDYVLHLSGVPEDGRQTIIAGENLLDMTRERSGEDVATVLIPLGSSSSTAEGTSGESEDPGTPLSGAAIETLAYNFCRQTMRLSVAVTAAILANIEAECSFNPAAIGDGGQSIGLIQWYASRRRDLIRWCQAHSLTYTDASAQLQYMQHDLIDNYPSVYRYMCNQPNTGDGAYNAAWYMCMYYEVPDARSSKAARRGRAARDRFFPHYSGTVAETNGQAATAAGTSGGESGALEAGSGAVTIESVNNGLDYIEDAEAVAVYGRIWRVETFSDITDPAQLKAAGEKWLKDNRGAAETIELRAVDLHLLDAAVPAIRAGRNYVVYNPYTEESDRILCTKAQLNLTDPSKNVYELGRDRKTLTGSIPPSQSDTQTDLIGRIETQAQIRRLDTMLSADVEALQQLLTAQAETIAGLQAQLPTEDNNEQEETT